MGWGVADGGGASDSMLGKGISPLHGAGSLPCLAGCGTHPAISPKHAARMAAASRAARAGRWRSLISGRRWSCRMRMLAAEGHTASHQPVRGNRARCVPCHAAGRPVDAGRRRGRAPTRGLHVREERGRTGREGRRLSNGLEEPRRCGPRAASQARRPARGLPGADPCRRSTTSSPRPRRRPRTRVARTTAGRGDCPEPPRSRRGRNPAAAG